MSEFLKSSIFLPGGPGPRLKMSENTLEKFENSGTIFKTLQSLISEWGSMSVILHLPATWKDNEVAKGMGGEIRREFSTVNSIDIEVAGCAFSSKEIVPIRMFRSFPLNEQDILRYQ
jgi:hypothetical protein